MVAGSFSRLLRGYKIDIVNEEPLTLEQIAPFCRQTKLSYEQILITDGGMAGLDDYAIKSAFFGLSLLREQEGWTQPVILITNRAALQDALLAGVRVEAYYGARIPIQKYLDAFSGKNARATAKKENTGTSREDTIDKPPAAKKSIAQRFRREKTKEQPACFADREFHKISREISRVIAITGHRSSGVTSTAVNLAQIACLRDLSTILIDLDTVNCAFNLYFGDYHEMAENNLDIACSLIRNLAKPQNYDINSYHRGNLYVVTLAYSFSDKELLERFYTPAKLINMLAVFRKHFQLCLLDLPIEALGNFKESILYVDMFGLCVSNSLHSLTSTLRGLGRYLPQEETVQLFEKSKIIVSKYDERLRIQNNCFSPEKVCDLLLELSDTLPAEQFELAGYVPYHAEFDSQLETDIPISKSDANMERAYSDILLRMIK